MQRIDWRLVRFLCGFTGLVLVSVALAYLTIGLLDAPQNLTIVTAFLRWSSVDLHWMLPASAWVLLAAHFAAHVRENWRRFRLSWAVCTVTDAMCYILFLVGKACALWASCGLLAHR